MAPKANNAAPKPAAAKPAAEKKAAPKAAATNTNGVYVKNWGAEGVESIKAIFASAGKVTAAQVRKGRYAQVWFDNAAASKKAIDTFNNKDIKGRTLTVTAARSLPKVDKHAGSKVVFAQPIFGESTKRKTILSFFASAGKVTKLRTYHNNGAFVYFESAAAAQKAINEKNGQKFGEKTLTVTASTRSVEKDQALNEKAKLLINVHQWKKNQK